MSAATQDGLYKTLCQRSKECSTTPSASKTHGECIGLGTTSTIRSGSVSTSSHVAITSDHRGAREAKCLPIIKPQDMPSSTRKTPPGNDAKVHATCNNLDLSCGGSPTASAESLGLGRACSDKQGTHGRCFQLHSEHAMPGGKRQTKSQCSVDTRVSAQSSNGPTDLFWECEAVSSPETPTQDEDDTWSNLAPTPICIDDASSGQQTKGCNTDNEKNHRVNQVGVHDEHPTNSASSKAAASTVVSTTAVAATTSASNFGRQPSAFAPPAPRTTAHATSYTSYRGLNWRHPEDRKRIIAHHAKWKQKIRCPKRRVKNLRMAMEIGGGEAPTGGFCEKKLKF